MAKKSISQDDVNKAVWKTCDSFQGIVDPGVYRDYIFSMLFLKYISDVWRQRQAEYTEKYPDNPGKVEALMKKERFVLPADVHFNQLYKHRYEIDIGERIDQSLEAIEGANASKLRGVFQGARFISEKLGDGSSKGRILRVLLEKFACPALSFRPGPGGNAHMVGAAGQFLIKKFAEGSGKKAGEFYTPPEVADLMAELMAPRRGDEICDPACGAGSFLLACGRKIRERYNGSRNYTLYGQEAVDSIWAMAKMNLFLNGEDNHRLEWGDVIRDPKLIDEDGGLKRFDVVAAHPPSGMRKWGVENAETDSFGRFRLGVPPKSKADYAFILHMIETLEPDRGRMAFASPNGVLYRGEEEGVIRKKLIEENLLDAVIGLPEKLLYGTDILTVILCFKKKKKHKKVLFIDASQGCHKVKTRNVLRREDIERITDAYRKRESIDKYASLVTLKTLRENNYNLNIPRYVDTSEEEEEYDLMELVKERKKLQAELADIESKFNKGLKDLGYDLGEV